MRKVKSEEVEEDIPVEEMAEEEMPVVNKVVDDEKAAAVVVARRARNTAAARKSRAKKVARVQALEAQVRTLERQSFPSE